ncbi:hypothetical protein LZC95_33100 [Pendulispora brunnea]|uniref:Uncharacterized protein n=1 Tax=Pendulispora brunnea TaxID=2905690 RepID=A0ABZ2K269_9BACT
MSPTAIPEDPLEVTQTTAPAFLELGGKAVPIARPPRPRQAPNSVPAAAPTTPDSQDGRGDPTSSGKMLVQGKGVPPLPARKGLMPLPRVSAPPAPRTPSPLPPSIVIDDSSEDLLDPGDDENATIPLPMEAVRQQLGERPSWPPLPPLPALTSPDMARNAIPLPPPAPGSPRPPSFGGSITLVGPPRPARRPPPAQAGYTTPLPHPYLPPPPPSSLPAPPMGPALPPHPMAAQMPMPPPLVHPIDLESMTAPARYRMQMPTVRREPGPLGARAGAPTLGRIWRGITDALSHPVLRSRGACAALGVLAGISIAVLYSEMTQPDLTNLRPEALQGYVQAAASPPPVPKAAPKPAPIPKVPQHIGVVMPEEEAPAASASGAPRNAQ